MRGSSQLFSDSLSHDSIQKTPLTPTLSPEYRGEGQDGHHRPAGFSLVELLVLLAILVILLSIFVPLPAPRRETDRRVRCTDNLRVIQQALKAYATANGNSLPRVTYEPSRQPAGYVAYTGAASPDPFARGPTSAPMT